MKKFLQIVLIFPLSTIFLSGFINKKIQKTINVTNNISSDQELQDRDYFGVSNQTHISNKCLNYSISETELNEMLSSGVKVVTIADQQWKRKISYKGMDGDSFNQWEVFDAEGICLGKKYILEGKEKIMNKYTARIENYQKEDFKNLNVQTTSLDSRENKPFKDNYKYNLSVQKDSQGRRINFLTSGKYTQFIILGKNNKVDFEGSLFDYSEIGTAPDGLTWRKVNNKYEMKIVENFRDGNQNVTATSIWMFDYLAE